MTCMTDSLDSVIFNVLVELRTILLVQYNEYNTVNKIQIYFVAKKQEKMPSCTTYVPFSLLISGRSILRRYQF